MSAKIEISKESMVEAMKFCHTREELVEHFKVSLSTIKRRLKEYNLSTFSRVFDESLFLQLYNEGLKDTEIAKKLNVSDGTICVYRNKLCLKKNFKYKSEQITDSILNLFIEGKSIDEISSILQLDQRLVNWTINRKSIYKDYVLNDTEFQVFLGGLLGDGSISKGKHTSRFCFAHSEKQKEYGIWKSGILKNIMMLNTSFNKVVRFDKRTQKEYAAYYSWTKHLEFLKQYRDKWYVNGVKRIQRDDLFKLDALGLAIWFQDDGYKGTSGYYIATLCFPYEDLIIIKDYFHEKWDIEVKIQKNNEVYIPAKYRDKFTQIIKPYIHDVCKYKLIESL